MSRVSIMGLNWYILGLGKIGQPVIDGPFPDMDSADKAGVELFGFQEGNRHRNYLIFTEWSHDRSVTFEKIMGILKFKKRGK